MAIITVIDSFSISSTRYISPLLASIYVSKYTLFQRVCIFRKDVCVLILDAQCQKLNKQKFYNIFHNYLDRQLIKSAFGSQVSYMEHASSINYVDALNSPLMTCDTISQKSLRSPLRSAFSQPKLQRTCQDILCFRPN